MHEFPVLRSALCAGILVPTPIAQVYGSGANGPFAPTADTTLDTSANGGVFEFTSIAIPAGVTVTLVGPNPAVLLCQGTADIAGTLDASGAPMTFGAAPPWAGTAGGPGGFAGGDVPLPGAGPGGGPPGFVFLYPASQVGCMGSHATPGLPSPPWGSLQTPAPAYGAALPFDLRGGSGGGGGAFLSFSVTSYAGAGGGGTIVLLAEDDITVSGTIRARGGDVSVFGAPRGGVGSGGSILLRSLACISVSGTIDARAGSTPTEPDPGEHGAGFVRIDGYSACGAPDLTGATIQPAPLVAPLPFLTDLGSPHIGQTYPVRCASAPGDTVTFWFSFGTSNIPVPPFGVIELDLGTLFTLGHFPVPSVGHDPLALIDVPIPNEAWLVGVTFYAQVVNGFGTVAGLPRISNLLPFTIGP